jgi:hypothetical protein
MRLVKGKLDKHLRAFVDSLDEHRLRSATGGEPRCD